MQFFESAFATLKKYAQFNGRASRQEFWTFFLFVILAQALARVIDAFLGRGGWMPGPFYGLVAIVLFLPQVAVTVRRLHDVGKSGREMVLPMVMLLALPLVAAFHGFIGRLITLGYAGVTLILFAGLLLQLIKKGSSIPNKYGAAPTAFSFGK